MTLVIVMGPSGSGKSTIGLQLATRLSSPFIEGDQFHTAASVSKMSKGIPLTDTDRWPWLDAIRQHCASKLIHSKKLVLACSALKRSYRNHLRNIPNTRIVFVYLKGSYQLILDRMQQRESHFMRPEMLKSQFESLEPPDCDEPDIITVKIDQPTEEILQQICDCLFIY